MSEYATSRFGWDAPSRIAGTSVMLQEQGALPVGLPLYSPLPFVPLIPTEQATTSDGHTLWQTTPSRCDLLFYQGDDIIIPLYFNDPVASGDDRSNQTWFAQIRAIHSYRSTLIGEFLTTAVYHPGESEADEYTMVELFLPRGDNDRWGTYHWDLYSVADTDLSRFPKPEGVDDLDWPPPDMVRTWLFGQANIVPRVTSTDMLVGSTGSGSTYVPYPGPPAGVTVVTTGGWTVGPNGRVP